jgi:hypothetical protein
MGEHGSELQDPAPDRLIGGLDAALCQEFLDIAVAEREPEIEPDCVLDDLGWELVTRVGDGLYPCGLPRTVPGRLSSCDKAIWKRVRGPLVAGAAIACYQAICLANPELRA